MKMCGKEELEIPFPFSFRILKSVEFVLTPGSLDTSLTDTFLEGNSPRCLRISLP